MKPILFLIFLLSFSAFAQEEVFLLPAPSYSTWQIGVSYSPDYAYRTLSGQPDWVIDQRNDTEDVIYGYTTGANIVFNTSYQFGIESGVHFSEKGYGNQVTYINGEGEEIGEGISRSVFDYIEIPLKVNYTIGQNTGQQKLRWTASAGIVNGILADARQVSSYTIDGEGEGKSSYNTTSDFKRYNLSAMAGIGFDWQVGNRLQLKVLPTFRYGLTKIVDWPITANDAPITARLWNLGLNTGLYFNL